MKRRRFLQSGLSAAAAPAVLPLLPRDPAAPWNVRPGPRRRPAAADDLRLNANENPLGVAPTARRAAMEAMDRAHLYPLELPGPVREALAHKHGVGSDGIVLGNGSTELIQVAIQSLVEPGYRVVSAHPTFDDVARYAGPSSVEVVTLPLTPDHAHDLEAMERAALAADGPALLYVCNPNNPTGTLTSCREVEALVERVPPRVHVLVDEAYFEYADHPDYWSFDRLAYERPNVVVLRTFSKVYGMAGMRLGYAVAHPERARGLRDFAADNNADQMVLAAALAALDDPEHVRRSVDTNARARDVLTGHLDRLGIEWIPSHTSFVMHRIEGDHADYRRRMYEAGARVGRPFPPMLGYNRLSLGTPEQMERFGAILGDFREKGWI